MERAMGRRPEDLQTDIGQLDTVLGSMITDADRFCAGSKPSQNGLEERLDMIVAQLSVIAIELHRMNDERHR